MSFGISIGDFIKVVEIAHRTISKCKAATLEFRDLSRDVVSMQIVLDAVRKYWEQQKLNGRDLLDTQKENLNELTSNCEGVLHDIEALLKKHGGLEAGTGLLNRIKWLRAGDLGPLRMRLLASTMYLSEFNRNVVALNGASDPQLGSQAVVLNALNVVNYRYHIGRRSAPAFSQATAADLEDDATWKVINEDLEKEGVDPSAIANEKPFIKKWIDDVILAEDNDAGHNDEAPQDDESLYSRPQFTSDGGQTHRSSYTDDTPTSPFRIPSRVETDRTLIDTSPTLNHAKLTFNRTKESRSSSSSQARRKSSTQTPRDQEIHANLDSLFRMNSGASKELVSGLIEHVYAQLDTSKRGVFSDRLESALMPVVTKTRPAAKKKVLEVIEEETIPGSRVDQATFTNILMRILESVDTAEKSLETVKTTESISNIRDLLKTADVVAYHWLLSQTTNPDLDSLLPYGWESETIGVGTKFFRYIPHNVTCHKTVLPRLPLSIVRTFANMLLLSRSCRAELDKIQDFWEAQEDLDEQYLKSSLELIEDVREATQKFEVFRSPKSIPLTAKLDDILGQAEVVDLTDAALLGSMDQLPIKGLRALQKSAAHSLQLILVFLIELTGEVYQSRLRDFEARITQRKDLTFPEMQYITKPPSPGQSRFKMESQASQILTDANIWYPTSADTIKACRSFAAEHPQLSERAGNALSGSKRMSMLSKHCKHLMAPSPDSLAADKFIILRLERVEDIPKGNKLFRAGPPEIEAMVYINRVRLSKSRRAALRLAPTTTAGRDVYWWNEAEPYHISVGERCKVYVHVHNAKRRDRDDEGFMGLVEIDVLTLPTGLDAESVTIPLRNSFAKAGVHPGNLTMRVHWCPLAMFVRDQQIGIAGMWARKNTGDGRTYFEDLRRDEGHTGNRTAVLERWEDA